MQKGLKIFVVEDDEWYAKMLLYTLNLNPDDQVTRFSSGKDFLKKLRGNDGPV